MWNMDVMHSAIKTQNCPLAVVKRQGSISGHLTGSQKTTKKLKDVEEKKKNRSEIQWASGAWEQTDFRC